jgi:hypothetical protein
MRRAVRAVTPPGNGAPRLSAGQTEPKATLRRIGAAPGMEKAAAPDAISARATVNAAKCVDSRTTIATSLPGRVTPK